MDSSALISNIFKIFLFFIICALVIYANFLFRDNSLFGSQIFLIDIFGANPKTVYTKFIIYIFSSIIAVIALSKFMNRYKNIFENVSNYQVAVITILFAFLIKLIILGFTFGNNDVTPKINEIFINGEFNDYKLYNYLAYIIYSFSDNYNLYLSIINILFGSITVGVIYLIFSKVVNKDLNPYIVVILSLLYIPLTSVETFLRVDTMYMLLLTSSIYYLLKIVNNSNNQDFLKLIGILILSCLCRESTLYMLPLFLFILMFNKAHKFKYIIGVSITVVLTSMLISSANLKNYNMQSKYKNFHLIIQAMCYGYLSDNHINTYRDNLSPNAKILLNDIEASYKNIIPPHKRASFNNPHFGGTKSYIWKFIRPDIENIATKTRITPYKGDLEKIKKDYIIILKSQKKYISKNDLENILTELSKSYDDLDDRNLSTYLKTLLMESFLAEKNDAYGNSGLCLVKNNIFKSSCVAEIVNGISNEWMTSRSDPWMYYKASFPFTLNFDPGTKKYIQHPQINYITEIILELPLLYVTQSLLTLTSMSGNSPTPSGLVEMSNIYNVSLMPEFILVTFQNIYTFIINFWYIFCFFSLIYSLFRTTYHSRNLDIIIAIVPLYYGLFICFAAQGEFARLMLPMVPFIIYSYLLVIINLYRMTKNITFASQVN